MEAKLYNPLDVVSNALDKHVQQVPRVVCKETNQHNEHSKDEADFTQSTDSNLQAADNGRCSECSYAPDDNQLVLCVFLDACEQATDTGIYLHDTKTQASTDTKHGANHRENVHQITHPSVHIVTKERIESGTDGHGKSFSVTNKGEEKTNNDVHDPSVDTPVEEGQIHGILSSLIISVSVQSKSTVSCFVPICKAL